DGLLGDVYLELFHVWRLARARHFEGLELALFGGRSDHHLLHRDLSGAVTRDHGFALPPRLLEFGLGRAHDDIGLRIVGEDGDDLVALDLLAIVDAQLGQSTDAVGVAGNPRRARRGV